MINSIRIPLQVVGGRIDRYKSLKEAIDTSLTMLLNTPIGSVPSNPHYGFTLQTLRFERVNETQGTIYTGVDDTNPVYDKKMSGTSKNMQTFAADLNEAVRLYEPRLGNTNVSMTYVAKSKTIVIVIKGIITETKEDYIFTSTVKLWT